MSLDVECKELSDVAFAEESHNTSAWRTEVVLVTPEMARDFLKMVRNRPVSEQHVRWFCGIIQRGEYRQTPNGISISHDGYVNGGQHRLHAIVRTGISLVMTINFGVPDDVAFLQDVGKAWSMSDQFRLDPHITGILSVFFRITVGLGRRIGRLTESQLKPFRDTFLETIKKTSQISRKGASSAPSRAAAVLCMLDKNEKYARDGYANLVSKGHRQNLSVAQHAYAEWLDEQKSFSGDTLTAGTFCRGLIAFDAQFSNRTRRTFGKYTDDNIEAMAEAGRARILEQVRIATGGNE